MSLSNLRDAVEGGNGLFQLNVARSLAAQLVMAVSIIHSRGYAHGDLHLSNLLLQFSSHLDQLSIEQLYERYGEPSKEPLLCEDTKAPSTDPGVPPYTVIPVWLGIPSEELTLGEAKLMLSDFGVAFKPSDKSRFKSYTPLIVRPPEAFFEPKTPLTLASDIWSLGCVIFELVAHRSLIDGNWFAQQDDITAQQVELQGPMPPGWWAAWEERPKWYDDAGRPLGNERDLWPWERRFEEWVQDPRRRCKMEPLSEEERDALFKLLHRMLAWRPSERPDVTEVLKSDWMTKWALPAYQKGLDGGLPRPN
ncbi:hypothetical protein UVI_02010370 [Ustilaginoidea virens]|uniref:Protein kinase domain-containing protein n=1 Tax=Ustilaginoidea virens TaxID=1159556 RepID=A0A1B5KWG6_USTVR|nr:hypothetical protein UVI_02010370 [Ustilaginoidea virens]